MSEVLSCVGLTTPSSHRLNNALIKSSEPELQLVLQKFLFNFFLLILCQLGQFRRNHDCYLFPNIPPKYTMMPNEEFPSIVFISSLDFKLWSVRLCVPLFYLKFAVWFWNIFRKPHILLLFEEEGWKWLADIFQALFIYILLCLHCVIHVSHACTYQSFETWIWIIAKIFSVLIVMISFWPICFYDEIFLKEGIEIWIMYHSEIL